MVEWRACAAISRLKSTASRNTQRGKLSRIEVRRRSTAFRLLVSSFELRQRQSSARRAAEGRLHEFLGSRASLFDRRSFFFSRLLEAWLV